MSSPEEVIDEYFEDSINYFGESEQSDVEELMREYAESVKDFIFKKIYQLSDRSNLRELKEEFDNLLEFKYE